MNSIDFNEITVEELTELEEIVTPIANRWCGGGC